MKKQTEFKTLNEHKINWLCNATAKGGAQKIVIDSKAPDSVVITSITDSKRRTPDGKIIEKRKYADVNTTEMKTLLNNNKGIFEIIHTYPHKIYFDVDGKGDKPNNYQEKVIDKINELFPDPDMAVSGSETTTKKSYHIVLNNYVINNEEEKQKFKAVVKYLKHNYDNGFDDVVYKPVQLMKCINQRKHDKTIESTQKIITNSNIEKHIITAFINEDS